MSANRSWKNFLILKAAFQQHFRTIGTACPEPSENAAPRGPWMTLGAVPRPRALGQLGGWSSFSPCLPSTPRNRKKKKNTWRQRSYPLSPDSLINYINLIENQIKKKEEDKACVQLARASPLASQLPPGPSRNPSAGSPPTHTEPAAGSNACLSILVFH